MSERASDWRHGLLVERIRWDLSEDSPGHFGVRVKVSAFGAGGVFMFGRIDESDHLDISVIKRQCRLALERDIERHGCQLTDAARVQLEAT